MSRRYVFIASLVAAGVATVVVAPATATAAIPDQGTFTNHDDVVAPSGELCEFPVHVIVDETGHYQVFWDRNGEFANLMVHIDYRAVFMANGHTLVERDKWWEGFHVDEAFRVVGLNVHIDDLSPGLLQHDAGQLIFNPDGSVTLHGIHQQFEAGVIPCWALQP